MHASFAANVSEPVVVQPVVRALCSAAFVPDGQLNVFGLFSEENDRLRDGSVTTRCGRIEGRGQHGRNGAWRLSRSGHKRGDKSQSCLQLAASMAHFWSEAAPSIVYPLSSHIGGLLEMSNARFHEHWGSLTEALGTGFPRNVIEEGPDPFEDFIRSQGLALRVSFHPGDIFEDPLAKANVLIMGHILHSWDPTSRRKGCCWEKSSTHCQPVEH